MKFSCVTFDIEKYKLGFDARDVLHIEPAVAVVKHPIQPTQAMGYVNVSGTFCPVYDILQFIDPTRNISELLPQHYFLFFNVQPGQQAAIRLLDLPTFEQAEIFETNDSQSDHTHRLAKVDLGTVILLSPQDFVVETQLGTLLPAMAEIFEHEIQVIDQTHPQTHELSHND